MPEMKRTGTVMMLMMSGSRRPDIRRPPRSTVIPRNIRRVSLLEPGAGPSRRRCGPGTLPTLSMPKRVMGPWRFVTSLWPVTSISATPFTTAWSMVFRSVGPGRHWAAIRPRSSHHRDVGWNCLRLLSLDLEGRPAESSSVALDIDEVAVSISSPSLAAKWRALGPDISQIHDGDLCDHAHDCVNNGDLDESVLLDFFTWNLEGRTFIALDVLDKVAASAILVDRFGQWQGRANCWHQITWMNPILQLECSLLGYPRQLARHPLLGRPLQSPDGVLSRPHPPGRHHHVLGQQRLLGRPRSLARHPLRSRAPLLTRHPPSRPIILRRVGNLSCASLPSCHPAGPVTMRRRPVPWCQAVRSGVPRSLKTGHLVPPSCFVDRQRTTFHTSRNKRHLMSNVTWKNAHSCDRLTSEVSSHQPTLFLASKNAWEGH